MKNFRREPDRDYSVSNAELEIQARLSQEKVMGWQSQHEFCLQSKTVDFYFPHLNLVVEIDGEQVHRNKEMKDQELRRLLKKRYGCTIRSYTYKAPLTKARLGEIVALIKDDVTGLRKMQK